MNNKKQLNCSSIEIEKRQRGISMLETWLKELERHNKPYQYYKENIKNKTI